MFLCPDVFASEGAAVLPEGPNFITIILSRLPEGHLRHWLHAWENVVFAWAIALLMACLLLWAARKRDMIPGSGQNFAEWLVENFEQAFSSMLGEHTRRFLPFLGTLFLYILAMNWAVLIPGFKSPTGGLILSGPEVISGGFITTASLALCVFFYVQYTAIRSNGIVRYLHHLMGSPNSAGEWALCILTLAPVTHILGELVRPVSLALRLFGNTTGDDILLGVFFVLGMMVYGAVKAPVPLQILVVPLVLLFGFVQAMIFTWLTAAYLGLSLAHHEEKIGETHA